MPTRGESGEAIELHDQPDHVEDVPQRLLIPSNLMVIGTVNIDETTHSFSPKVLDRAFTVELTRVNVRGLGRKMVQRTEIKAHQDLIEGTIEVLALLNETWEPHGLHFAYRTVDGLCRFLVRNAASTPSFPQTDATDLMLMQKVLPNSGAMTACFPCCRRCTTR